MDLKKLEDTIRQNGPAKKIPFVRLEATTNLIGGQPFSMANMKAVRKICDKHKLILVLDGSLLSENAYFIWKREKGYGIKRSPRSSKRCAAWPTSTT